MPRTRKPRLLITAGPTREYLDPVRYLSNDSSGQMGFALAQGAQRRGMHVTLVHGPVMLKPPGNVQTVAVVSAAKMLAACTELWPKHDVLIMAAAVADYTPLQPAKRKRKKSTNTLELRLKPTVDILARLSVNRREDQIVIGFALEDRCPRRNAELKLKNKDLDAIVLNQPAAIGARHCPIEVLIRDEDWQLFPDASKTRQAARIIRLAEQLWTAR